MNFFLCCFSCYLKFFHLRRCPSLFSWVRTSIDKGLVSKAYAYSSSWWIDVLVDKITLFVSFTSFLTLISTGVAMPFHVFLISAFFALEVNLTVFVGMQVFTLTLLAKATVQMLAYIFFKTFFLFDFGLASSINISVTPNSSISVINLTTDSTLSLSVLFLHCAWRISCSTPFIKISGWECFSFTNKFLKRRLEAERITLCALNFTG